MSGQKQNLLRLMIVCCVACQIRLLGLSVLTCAHSEPTEKCDNCSKILIVGANLTFDRSTCSAINLTCPPYYEILIGDFCKIKVKPNSSSMGVCKSSTEKTYFFNISNNSGKYEVSMNDTVEGITMWFLQSQSKCLESEVLNSTEFTGPHTMNCQKQKTTTINQARTVTKTTVVCNGNEESRYVLSFSGSEWMCVTCTEDRSTTSFTTQTPTTKPTTTPKPVDTVKPPDMTLNLTADYPTDSTGLSGQHWIEPSKASETLDNLKSLLDEIKNSNKSNAAIVMGNVIGLLQVQDKISKTKDINICYSSVQNLINVVETNQRTNFPWSMKIPSEAFDKSRLENNGSAFVGVLRYTNMDKKDKTKNYTVLNGDVYGVTMGANISSLTNNIEMFIKQKNLASNASCSSWDGKGQLEWTTSGCETEQIDNNTIKCSCSHLTFFAVLMSVPAANVTVTDLESLSFISSIGCGISMFFLAVALFMHFLLRKAKSNQATKILINMFVALFLLNLSFLSNESVANSGDKAACVFIALLMHYSMLATFTWFFIQALHLYLWLIRQNVTISNYIRKITVLGWGCSAPIVVVVVSLGGYEENILKSTTGKITRLCWITNPYIHYIVNIGYYIFVFIFTAGIFIVMVTKIVEARHMRATDGKRKTFRKQLMMVLSLFLLFGLTWAVAFFSYGPMLTPSYYIFTVLNSFQGFFLFVYYYHIHRDVAGHFSDDPESSASTSSIAKSTITAVENVYN